MPAMPKPTAWVPNEPETQPFKCSDRTFQGFSTEWPYCSELDDGYERHELGKIRSNLLDIDPDMWNAIEDLV